MVTYSEDINISIGGSDYTTSINEISESGGERKYVIKKMFNNNYKRIETGREDYTISLNFKMESTVLNSLYEVTSPTTVAVSGSDFTITYYNMMPTSLIISEEVDGIATGKIEYKAPAYDKTNNRYNKVIN